MRFLRPTSWVLLTSLLGLYAYCWTSPGDYEQYRPGLSISNELNLAIDYQARSVVAYSDRAGGPYRPYVMIAYVVQPPDAITQGRWLGIYYYTYTAPRYKSWTLGISLLYLIAPLVLLVAYLEYRAAKTRRRRKQNACPSCGYLRQGLKTQTMQCPECGYDLYGPPY